MSGLILVTGGSGKTGRRLAQQLRDQNVSYRAAARGTRGNSDTFPFDWLDRSTWRAALTGVSGVYLVAPAIQGDPAPIVIDFVKEAIGAGAKRFVLLSASLLPAGGPGMGQVHKWLEDNAEGWAVLRPSWFMQNFSEGPHLETIRKEGRIYSAAGDGRVPFIDANDIAACAASALTSAAPASADFILTGGDLLSYDDVAAVISQVSGQSVTHSRLTAGELQKLHESRGLNPVAAQMLSMMDTAIAHGAEDRITSSVVDLTGRQPKSFAEFANENAHLWRLTKGNGSPLVLSSIS